MCILFHIIVIRYYNDSNLSRHLVFLNLSGMCVLVMYVYNIHTLGMSNGHFFTDQDQQF